MQIDTDTRSVSTCNSQLRRVSSDVASRLAIAISRLERLGIDDAIVRSMLSTSKTDLLLAVEVSNNALDRAAFSINH